MTTNRWRGATVGAALLLAMTAAGCGGGGAFFPTPNNLIIHGTPPPAGGNTVTGSLTLGAGAVNPTISLFSNTAVGTAPTLVTTTTAVGGAFTLSGLADGSYTVVLSGSGDRPQTDNFSIAGGQTITANYTVTALSGAPSKQELQGFTTLAAHLTRAVYGMRSAVPLANAVFQENILHTDRTLAAPTFISNNIAVANTAGVTVDSKGHVWVPTSAGAGTVLLSNSGSFLGQFFSGTAGAVATSDTASVDANDDVLVLNSDHSAAVFPAGSTNATVTGDVDPHAFGATAQNGSVTFGTTAVNSPHFIVGGGGLEPVTSTGQVLGTHLVNNGTNNVGNCITVNPQDNTIWVGASNITTLPGNPEVIQFPADAASFQQQINLITVAGLTATDTVTGVAFDNNNDLFVSTTSSTLPVLKLTNGTTLAASGGAGLFPNGASAIAVDANGNVWATAKGGTTAVQFSNTLTNPATSTVLANPTQVAVDANGNAFVAAPSGITRIAAGTPILPPNGNTTIGPLADGSTITITIANGVTTVTQVFPGNITDSFNFGGTTAVNGNTLATLNGTSAYGPTTSTIVITQNPTTGVLTYSATTSTLYDGTQSISTTTVNPDGSETVTGALSNGEVFNCTFSAPAANTGTVTMTGTYTDSTTGASLSVAATFLADGSMSSYTITNVAAGLVATGALSNQGAWTTSVTQNNSNTVLATATDAQLQDVLVLIQTLNPSINAINNFVFAGTSLSSNVYANGINGTFSDTTTFTDDGGSFNDQTSSGDGNVTPGQGDGNAADSATGQGTYVASEGGGSTLPIRGIR